MNIWTVEQRRDSLNVVEYDVVRKNPDKWLYVGGFAEEAQWVADELNRLEARIKQLDGTFERTRE